MTSLHMGRLHAQSTIMPACQSASQPACFTLSSHAKSLCSQKLQSVLEIQEILRKQIITKKTFENKAPSTYILSLLLLLPSSTNFQKHLPDSSQQTVREIASPHLHKMAAALLTTTRWLPPPPHLCHHTPPAPAGGPGGSKGSQATVGPQLSLLWDSIIHPCSGIFVDPTTLPHYY